MVNDKNRGKISIALYFWLSSEIPEMQVQARKYGG
jgi:hypothetical protein